MKRRTMTSTMPKLVLTAAVTTALAACGGSSGDGGGGTADENLDGIADVTLTTDEDNDGLDDVDVNGDGRADFDVNGDGIRDTDINGDGSVDFTVVDEFGLAGFDTDADGVADFDLNREPITEEPQVTPVSAENPCGDATGSDNNSSNAAWTDNCTVSISNQHSNSTYTAGIQRIVWCAGFDGGSGAASVDAFTDGSFGNQTRQAVIDFQAANDVTADGIVGPQTWGELRDALTDDPLEFATGGGIEPYGVEGDRCEDLALFLADTAFEDSEAVINGWQLTQGATNRTAVEFGVTSVAVD